MRQSRRTASRRKPETANRRDGVALRMGPDRWGEDLGAPSVRFVPDSSAPGLSRAVRVAPPIVCLYPIVGFAVSWGDGEPTERLKSGADFRL